VFTISYEAPSSARSALQRISRGTGARQVDGNPQNIEAVLRDLSSFL
jgi:hypothetical protein